MSKSQRQSNSVRSTGAVIPFPLERIVRIPPRRRARPVPIFGLRVVWRNPAPPITPSTDPIAERRQRALAVVRELLLNSVPGKEMI